MILRMCSNVPGIEPSLVKSGGFHPGRLGWVNEWPAFWRRKKRMQTGTA